MKQLGVLENTLIVVLSDHGEEFWDHGRTAHGRTVYEELTHVGFMMWGPALFPAAKRVKEPVQLIDIVPTVLDLLKLIRSRVDRPYYGRLLRTPFGQQSATILYSFRYSHAARKDSAMRDRVPLGLSEATARSSSTRS